MALTPEHEVNIRTGYSNTNCTFAKGTGTDPLGTDWWTLTATNAGVIYHYCSHPGLSLSSDTYFVCAIVKPATVGDVAMINKASGPEPGLLMDGSGSPALLYGTGGYRYEGDFGGEPVYTLWFEIADWAGGNVYWQTFDPNSPYFPDYEQAGENFNIGTFWIEAKGANSEPSSLDLGETVGENLTLAESVTSHTEVTIAVSESLTLSETVGFPASLDRENELNIRGYGAVKGASGQAMKGESGKALKASDGGAPSVNAIWTTGSGFDPIGTEWWTLTAINRGPAAHHAYFDPGTLTSDDYFVCAIVKPGSSNKLSISATGGPSPSFGMTGIGTVLSGVGDIRFEGVFDGDVVYTVWFEMDSWTGSDIYWACLDAGNNTVFEQADESFQVGTFWIETRGGNSEPAPLGLGSQASFLGDSAHASDSYTVSGGGVNSGVLETDVWFPLIASGVLAADVASVTNDGPFVTIIGSGSLTITFTAYRADLTVADNESLDLINGSLVELNGNIELISGPNATTDENGQVTVTVNSVLIGNATIKISISGIVGIASVQVAAVPAPGVGVISAWSKPLTRT